MLTRTFLILLHSYFSINGFFEIIFNVISRRQLFIESEIQYAGQPIGVIVAETQALANEAAGKVKVTYTDTLKEKAIVTIHDAIESNDKTLLLQTAHMPAKRKGLTIAFIQSLVFLFMLPISYLLLSISEVVTASSNGQLDDGQRRTISYIFVLLLPPLSSAVWKTFWRRYRRDTRDKG